MRLKDAAPTVGFGTSGVRALVCDLTPSVVHLFTRAFVRRIRSAMGVEAASRCVIGWDLRPSSPDIASAVCVGLAAEGVDVEIAGPCLTPALALRSLSGGMSGIMVTGSHIPFDRNGLKFYTPKGEIMKGDEAAINEADVSVFDFDPEDIQGQQAVWRARLDKSSGDVMAAYRGRYLDVFPRGVLDGLRVGVYQHSAVGRDFLADLLTALGCTVVPLGRSETFIPIDTEAVLPEDEERARAWAKEFALDAIVSTDGDGDRPWICDENGRFLRGDIVGVLCAWRLGVRRIVTPISSNTAAEKSGYFDEVVRTRIGSPFVLEAMDAIERRGVSVAGFEANGGFLLGGDVELSGRRLRSLPTRDSTLPILLILLLAAERSVRVSNLLALLPERRTSSGSIKGIPIASSSALLESLRRRPEELAHLLSFAGGSVVSLNDLDGLRVELSSGDVIHLRPSGNAPEFRCYTEADTQTRADDLLHAALEAVGRACAKRDAELPS